MTGNGNNWKIGDGEQWSFLNGNWEDAADSELVPPDGFDLEYIAVRNDAVYADFSASFRFKFRAAGGCARLLFRMQDTRRFYALDIPINGQQARSRHFWAGLVVVDGGPLQRYLNFALVPGLCPRIDHWYDARVEATGSRLRAWINDIPVADVEDSTFASGRLGLTALVNPYEENCHFSSLQVEGTEEEATPWPGLQKPEPHWITPCPEPEPETYQSYASLIKSNSGDVTLYLSFGNPNSCETRRGAYIRSTDAGRTWGKQEPATLQQGLGAPFVRLDGTWVCVFPNHPIHKESLLYCYESADEGRSWTGPAPLKIEGGWPAEWRPVGGWRPVRMHDGAIVLPILSGLVDEPKSPSLVPFHAAITLRSEDDGHTWSAPVLCDRQHLKPGEPVTTEMGGGLVHAARYFEVAIAEADDDVLIGIGRPERDPYMWNIRSNDGGRTWEPGALGHFPGYCPALTRTASGAIVATTRFPHFAARLSRDGGRTWEPPVIVDYCGWANQQAVEIEPDVVLVTYMGEITHPGKADSRIARIRVTDDGLVLDHGAG
ncbi:MAG: exo-alpha-sialidase [Lentisphaeria bacterium]|jgi:hypothetical protein|nr:exo-alpha-sialidase [Lentisphaeria bacterium]